MNLSNPIQYTQTSFLDKLACPFELGSVDGKKLDTFPICLQANEIQSDI